MAALAAILAVALAVIWVASRPGPPPDRSVAVLPFDVIADDPDVQLFAEGLTDELRHVLSARNRLRVIGRTSSIYFRDRDDDLRSIGETLGVAHVLEGSVRRSGDRVRVFDGRGDNPGISAAERFNHCAEACSKRLEPIEGAWTSNAAAFVYYEGVAGDALNGRCWCELSSGCNDELEIDGLTDVHFVSFGAGDTSFNMRYRPGLPVYYFLGPDTMSVSSFGNFRLEPPL